MKPLVTILCAMVWLAPSAGAGDGVTNLLVPMFKAVAERSAPSDLTTEEILATSANRLRERFDGWLKEPLEYRRKALLECRVFPEGRLYPFAIPALGYANLALGDAKAAKTSAAQMRKLIDALISTVVEDMSPPGADLTGLGHYQKQGTRLATLNLTLACYALISTNSHYERLHDHLSVLLRQALAERPGIPLTSYPEYTWFFDTIMALVSLEMHDRAHGLARTRDLIERHLAWVRHSATDAETGLPVAYEGGVPRGCDISMQVCLLQQINPRAARQLYADYVRHHWVDLGFIAGFREWPKSKGLGLLGDIDSGPLMLGIGPTATGVGLGAAKAMGDTNRLDVLARQLRLLPGFVQMLEQSGQKPFGAEVPISSQYTTGFLYGDAVLFYALTWVPYPAEAPEAQRPTPAKPRLQ